MLRVIENVALTKMSVSEMAARNAKDEKIVDAVMNGQCIEKYDLKYGGTKLTGTTRNL